MKLLNAAPGPPTNVHNGDPRNWPAGLYRSARDGHIVIVADGSAISITATGAGSTRPPLYDGYVPLPEGEIVRIEA